MFQNYEELDSFCVWYGICTTSRSVDLIQFHYDDSYTIMAMFRCLHITGPKYINFVFLCVIE